MARRSSSIPLRCANCGWRTARKLERAHKPCPKCGGRLQFNGSPEDEAALVVIVIGGMVLMLVFALIWVALDLGP